MDPLSIFHTLLLGWHFRKFVKTLLGCISGLVLLLFVWHMTLDGFDYVPKDWEFSVIMGLAFLLAIVIHVRRWRALR